VKISLFKTKSSNSDLGGRRGREKQTDYCLNDPIQKPTPIKSKSVGMLAIAVTLKNLKKKKKKHCPITFIIFTRQLISTSLPPEKRRDLIPIP
jgi:hypothetical protein